MHFLRPESYAQSFDSLAGLLLLSRFAAASFYHAELCCGLLQHLVLLLVGHLQLPTIRPKLVKLLLLGIPGGFQLLDLRLLLFLSIFEPLGVGA